MTQISGNLKPIAAEVLDVCYFVGPSRHVYSRIWRSPAHQLIVITAGVYKAIVDTPAGRTYIRAIADDVVSWPAGVDHTDESEPGKSLRGIVIPSEVEESRHSATDADPSTSSG